MLGGMSCAAAQKVCADMFGVQVCGPSTVSRAHNKTFASFVAYRLGFDYLFCGDGLTPEKLVALHSQQNTEKALEGWSSPRGTAASSHCVGYKN